MARLEDAPSAAQHYTRVIAAEIARTQPGRKYLAVHEGQLAVKPSLHLLHEHRRPLLLCLEQTRRPAMLRKWSAQARCRRDRFCSSRSRGPNHRQPERGQSPAEGLRRDGAAPARTTEARTHVRHCERSAAQADSGGSP